MNNSLQSLIRRKVFALRKSNIYKSYQLQKKVRYLEYNEIKRLQFWRLRNILSYAYDNSSFYHRYFDSNGLKPKDITNFTDFEALPSINKAIMKSNFEDILISNNFGHIEDFTSGSTGEPFKFIKDVRNELPLEQAAYMLFKEGVGMDPFNSGNMLVIKTYPKNRICGYRDIERNLVYKGFFQRSSFGISVSDIQENNLDLIIDVIEKLEIRVIYGFSQSIFSLMVLLKKKGYKPRLDFLIGIGEVMLERQREWLKSYLNCKVFVDYGSSECMRIGFECSEGRMHLDIYRYHLKAVNDIGEIVPIGGKGQIVITNLNNFVFPFIKYDSGDGIILSDIKCDCGCSFPVIEEIVGRSTDCITSKRGEKHATIFTTIFEHYHEYIDRYQIIQRSEELVEIKIITTRIFSNKISKEIKIKFDEKTNNAFKFVINEVKEILPEQTGKYKVIKPLAKEVIKNEYN